MTMSVSSTRVLFFFFHPAAMQMQCNASGSVTLTVSLNDEPAVQHAVGYVAGDEYYGAKASINVWAPKVSTASEFSLSQIWVIAGSFGNDLNTIEAGWQVSPQLYGDNSPRFFTYWTVTTLACLLARSWTRSSSD